MHDWGRKEIESANLYSPFFLLTASSSSSLHIEVRAKKIQGTFFLSPGIKRKRKKYFAKKSKEKRRLLSWSYKV